MYLNRWFGPVIMLVGSLYLMYPPLGPILNPSIRVNKGRSSRAGVVPGPSERPPWADRLPAGSSLRDPFGDVRLVWDPARFLLLGRPTTAPDVPSERVIEEPAEGVPWYLRGLWGVPNPLAMFERARPGLEPVMDGWLDAVEDLIPNIFGAPGPVIPVLGGIVAGNRTRHASIGGRWLTIGDRVETWTVQEIEEGHVTLVDEGGGRLRLDFDESVAALLARVRQARWIQQEVPTF